MVTEDKVAAGRAKSVLAECERRLLLLTFQFHLSDRLQVDLIRAIS